jgi:SAM-dependent methyltransferase
MKAAERGWYENPVSSDRRVERRQQQIFVHRKFQPRPEWALDYNHMSFLHRPPSRGMRLMDLGCGEGSFLNCARPLYSEVVGIDFDRDAVDAAKRMYGLEHVYAATIQEFRAAFPDRRFDVVTLFEILEHVEDPVDFIESVKELLTAGGRIALSMPNRNRKGAASDSLDQPPVHLTKWTGPGLRRFLSDHDFRVVTLCDMKADWTGRFEHEWFLVSRLDPLLRAVFGRLHRHEVVRFHDRVYEVEVESNGSVLLHRVIRKVSGALWHPLSPVYRTMRNPSFGLYAEAVLEPGLRHTPLSMGRSGDR